MKKFLVIIVDEVSFLGDEHSDIMKGSLSFREKSHLGSSRDWSPEGTSGAVSQELQPHRLYKAPRHGCLPSRSVIWDSGISSNRLMLRSWWRLLIRDTIMVIPILMWRSGALIVQIGHATVASLPLLNESEAKYHAEALDNAEVVSAARAVSSWLFWNRFGMLQPTSSSTSDALGCTPRSEGEYRD